MTKIRAVLILTLGIAAGAVASYGYVHRSAGTGTSLSAAPPASAAEPAEPAESDRPAPDDA